MTNQGGNGKRNRIKSRVFFDFIHYIADVLKAVYNFKFPLNSIYL